MKFSVSNAVSSTKRFFGDHFSRENGLTVTAFGLSASRTGLVNLKVASLEAELTEAKELFRLALDGLVKEQTDRVDTLIVNHMMDINDVRKDATGRAYERGHEAGLKDGTNLARRIDPQITTKAVAQSIATKIALGFLNVEKIIIDVKLEEAKQVEATAEAFMNAL